MWEYFIFIVLGCTMSDAMVKPIYLWPLSGLSNVLEVMTNGSALSNCFPTGPGHPDLDYTSLYFDGTQYVDVRVPSNPNITDKDIVFSLFFKAETYSGVLFDYEADDQTTSYGITSMDVEVKAGNVKGTMCITGDTVLQVSLTETPFSVTQDKWTMLALAYSFMNDTLSIYVDSKKNVTYYGGYHFFSLITPGTLRFGNSPNVFHQYTGFVTAAALYNSEWDLNEQDLLQNALKSNWSWIPPVPPCFETSHVWTLDNKGLTMDLKTSKKNKQDCLRFSDKHPNLPNNAILMDGSALSTLTLEINGTEIDSNFDLVINIHVPNPTSGSLIKITDRFERVLFDFIIDETIINLNAFLINGTVCGSISMEQEFNTSTWYSVGIKRNISDETVAILINDDISNSTSDSCGMFGLTEGAMVKIGKSTTPGFRGLVRCLVMFNSLESNVTEAHNDICLSEDDNVPSGLVNECTTQCPRSTRYDLFKSNQVLPDSLAPLAVYNPTSRMECVGYCFRFQFCRSFTYFYNKCSIYDFVTDQQLVTAFGAYYYFVAE